MKKFDGISAFVLHMLAMLFMLCDHLWATLVPGNMWLTCIGRMAFPIFAFLLVEGIHYTRDRKKYLTRLLVLALVSEIPFNLMYDGGVWYPFHQNVIWTFLISFVCISGIEKLRKKGRPWLTVLGIAGIAIVGALLALLLATDYFGGGVLTVILFYLFRGRKWWQLAGQAAGLYWINCVLLGGLFIPVEIGGHYLEIPQQGFALFALLFIWLYRGRQGLHNRSVQIGCYAFYPAHMLLLALIAGLM